MSMQSLKLGGGPDKGQGSSIRRINRVPVIAALILIVAFIAVIFYGLATRGLYNRSGGDNATSSGNPASSYADQLKSGVPNAIIGDPQPFAPAPQPIMGEKETNQPFSPQPKAAETQQAPELEPEDAWRKRLEREQEEQWMREQQRQRMARMQAADTAYDAPLAIDRSKFEAKPNAPIAPNSTPGSGYPTGTNSTSDLFAAALQAGLNGQNLDPNGQRAKEGFINSDMRAAGYLPNRLIPQRSPYELKRGSVIPATLITGINSDLPGRIIAQVSQNVYDSATGYRLLVPQGTKLFGRYDSKVSFGQSRVLVVWTDIVFPNGSTLQIGGMAGTDAAGYGGFKDKVNNHYFRTFGSAVLTALIGTGIDMAIPQDRNVFGTSNTAEDAARRNFADTFGRMAERTIDRNLNTQPTLEIRPGYMFNVLVDQDIVFPGVYRS